MAQDTVARSPLLSISAGLLAFALGCQLDDSVQPYGENARLLETADATTLLCAETISSCISAEELCENPGTRRERRRCRRVLRECETIVAAECGSCDDGIRNGAETAVDCGGGCSACPVSPSCSDGVQNGVEAGVDCGGDCGACPTETETPFTSEEWEILYDGYGAVALNGSSARLSPLASTQPDETHAALILLRQTSENPVADFEVSLRVTNHAQLRSPTPNPWEVFWLFTNYVPTVGLNKQANYVMLKPNGLEIGTAFDGLGQEFVVTQPTPTVAIGESYWMTVRKEDRRLQVWVNGEQAVDHVDAAGVLFQEPGTFGLYTEDADVEIDSFKYSPLRPSASCNDGIQNGSETGVDCGGSCESCDSPPAEFSTAVGRPIPDTLYGVTVESVDNLSALSESLERHTATPTVRIVFQQGTGVNDYTGAVDTLRLNSYIMGEILDSTAVGATTVSAYRTRAQNFVDALGGKVDLWEIGNEVNGEWLGTPTSIRSKIEAGFDVVETANLRSVLTLNYWPNSNCYSQDWEATIPFAQSIAERVRTGLDYVLLSFYETACDPVARPSAVEIAETFAQLKTIFPNAKVGFGEIGAQGASDGFPEPSLSEKQRIANTYYGMHGELKNLLGSRYVGGYFWWYYYQEAVPYDRPGSMWPTIENNFNSY